MRLWPFFITTGLSALAFACGARSGLEVPSMGGAAPEGDAGTDDSATDGARDATVDAHDAAPDADDAAPDVIAPSCVDAGITYIYVITSQRVLYRFYPPTSTFEAIGTIACADTASVYSMAVDRQGIAQVVFSDGRLYRVSTATASCQRTSFRSGQRGFTQTFGMGFVADSHDPGETLFVAGTSTSPGVAGELGTIELDTYNLNLVGRFSWNIGDAELTGTGGGALYAFGVDNAASPVALHLADIDKVSGSIRSDQLLTFPSAGGPLTGWAFAYWGGSFYFFTSTDSTTSVASRYTPGGAPIVTPVAKLGAMIVGAGVSTCAPVN